MILNFPSDNSVKQQPTLQSFCEKNCAFASQNSTLTQIKGILLYQWFPRPIFPKHPSLLSRCLEGKIGLGSPW